MINENGIQISTLRKIIDEEFVRVSEAAQQKYHGSAEMFKVKSKIVDLMAEVGVLDGTLSRRQE